MKKQLNTALTILISLLLAGGLIYWTLRDTDFGKIWNSIQQANYYWVALSVMLGILAYFFRSQRWRLLLQPLGYNPKPSYAFAAVCMNYFWNILIPRSGEVARCTSLYTMDKTPVEKSFGTVISERAIDFVCLIIVFVLTAIFNYDLVVKLFSEMGSQEQGGEKSNTNLYIILGSILLIVLGFYVFRKFFSHTVIYRKIRVFLYGLRKGLTSIFMLKKKRAFLWYTLAIWVSYYLMTYVMVFALPESSHITPAQGLFLLFVGGIGMVIPASGGIGAYHAAMRLGFTVLGLSPELGITFGFLVHTPHTLIAIVLGLISFGIMFAARSENKKKLDNSSLEN